MRAWHASARATSREMPMPTTEHGAARSDSLGVLVSLPQVADGRRESGALSRWLHTHGAATVAIARRDSLRGGLLLLVGGHVWASTHAQAGPYLRSGESAGVAGPQVFGWRVAHGAPRDAATGSHHPLETRDAPTTSNSGDAGNLPILAAALAVDVAALTRGRRRAVLPCRLRGGLAVARSDGGADSYIRGTTVELTPQRGRESGQRADRGAATLIRGACARCMAREMGPPRRVERRAGAFTRAPVAQSAEPVRSIRGADPGSIAWVAGSNPAGRNFPFREEF